jgi:hypothetical protein
VILPPKPVAEPAPQPVLPDWPANDKPTPATVTWNSQGLLVTASNSSLAQILSDISTATGTEIDGFSNDQRIFGSYGPGQTREILSQLLQGTGYNVVMVGDQGQGTPRHMLLSTRNATSAAVGKVEAKSSDDEDADDDEPAPPPTPQPVRPMPGGPPRTPLEMMQQRQQQMQQQRGQQPPNPPN